MNHTLLFLLLACACARGQVSFVGWNSLPPNTNMGINDLFAEASDTDLTNHVTAEGYSWVNRNWLAASSYMYISNTQDYVFADVTGLRPLYYVATNMPSANYEAQIDVVINTAGSSEACLGVRYDGQTNSLLDAYLISYFPDVSGGSCRLIKSVDGTRTDLTANYTGLGAAGTHTIKIRASNTVITGWFDATQIGTTNDSDISAVGYVAIGSALRNSRYNTGLYYDSLSATNIP